MVRLYRRRSHIVFIVIIFLFFAILLFLMTQNKFTLRMTSGIVFSTIKDSMKKDDAMLELLDVSTRDKLLNHDFIEGRSKSNDESILSMEYNQLEKIEVKNVQTRKQVSYNVHAFYYAWYGNPKFDEDYFHWNHQFMPHWTSHISKQYATGKRHVPPDDIGANFYPELGPYSSRDPTVLQKHMEFFVQAGIGVLALSWYPQNRADTEGKPSDNFVPIILESAAKYGVKVCFHIEPYKDRSALSVADDIRYILRKYQHHTAFYKAVHVKKNQEKLLPLVYVYDSYLTPASEWRSILSDDGTRTSIRGTTDDAIVIGLLVEEGHKRDILDANFDGFYTYFASSGFSYGSSQEHWSLLSRFANQNNLLFVPSVGPGYIDTNVRPWNGQNTKHREKGNYYNRAWEKALQVHPDFVSITSFNEWHEGTQIEPAANNKKPVHVEHVLGSPHGGLFSYKTYDSDPNMYLDLTRQWVESFSKT